MNEDDQQHKELPAAAAPAPAVASVRDRRTLAGLAFAAGVLALALGGYNWYQSAVQNRLAAGQQASRVAGLTAAVAGVQSAQSRQDDRDDKLRQQLDGNLAALHERLDTATAALRKQAVDGQQRLDNKVQALQGEMTTLSGSVATVTDELHRSATTLAVRETEQLLVLANRQLRLAGNAAVAATALQLADDRLRALGDQRFVAVRRQLADDLARLAAVPPVDVDGIALQLASLAGHATDLPLAGNAPPAREISAGAPAASASAAGGGLAAAGRELLGDVTALVKIKHIKQTGAPTLSASQEALIYQNLQLQLGAARIALLRRDADLYQQSLAGASAWVRRRFRSDAAPVGKFVSQLDTLAAIDIKPPLPDVSAALEALRQAGRQDAS